MGGQASKPEGDEQESADSAPGGFCTMGDRCCMPSEPSSDDQAPSGPGVLGCPPGTEAPRLVGNSGTQTADVDLKDTEAEEPVSTVRCPSLLARLRCCCIQFKITVGAITSKSQVLCIVPNVGAEGKEAKEVKRSPVTKLS